MGDAPLDISSSGLTAVLALSSLETCEKPMRPMMPRESGSQVLFAAATVMRPATNEFPRSEPATTRQMRTAATMATCLPRKCVIAVWSIVNEVASVSHSQRTTAALSVTDTTFQGSRT